MRRILITDSGPGKALPESVNGFADFIFDAVGKAGFSFENLTVEVLLADKKPESALCAYGDRCFLVLCNIGRLSPKDDCKVSVLRGKIDLFLQKQGLSIPEGHYLVLRLSGKDIPGNGRQLEKKDSAESTDSLPTYIPQDPKFNFSQIVISNAMRDEISRAISAIRFRELIYGKWGFSKVDPSAKSILNFYGPPGTGKTMTAHAVAAELGCKILVMNYADIESKYVGDAPKNLRHAFEEAQKNNALLFFDEADSFLGKRITSVSSSSDQAVNSLRSQMLIFLENFDGVVVFCTNLVKNYDRAFETRISSHIKFDLPDVQQRMAIFDKTIPSEVPFKDGIRPSRDQFEALAIAADGFSGRDIKNAVLGALTSVALAERDCFVFDDFVAAVGAVARQMEQLKKETGRLSSTEQKSVEAKIKASLKTGDYATTSPIEVGDTTERRD